MGDVHLEVRRREGERRPPNFAKLRYRPWRLVTRRRYQAVGRLGSRPCISFHLCRLTAGHALARTARDTLCRHSSSGGPGPRARDRHYHGRHRSVSGRSPFTFDHYRWHALQRPRDNGALGLRDPCYGHYGWRHKRGSHWAFWSPTFYRHSGDVVHLRRNCALCIAGRGRSDSSGLRKLDQQLGGRLAQRDLGADRDGRHMAFVQANENRGRIYAIGSDKEGARIAGVNTDRTIVVTYAILGIFRGHSSLVLRDAYGVGRPHIW